MLSKCVFKSQFTKFVERAALVALANRARDRAWFLGRLSYLTDLKIVLFVVSDTRENFSFYKVKK